VWPFLCAQRLGGADSVTEDLDSIGVVKATAFIACNDDFTVLPVVGNGAGELLIDVFGDAGKHVKIAVVVSASPLHVPRGVGFNSSGSPPGPCPTSPSIRSQQTGSKHVRRGTRLLRHGRRKRR